MATYRQRGDSYQIIGYAGYDVSGRQITKTKTIKLSPEKFCTEKQREKELNRLCVIFQEEIDNGIPII